MMETSEVPRISMVQNEEMKRRKDDSGYEGNGRRTRTPRTVLILGGEDVMSPLYSLIIFVIVKYNCIGLPVRSSRPRPSPAKP